MHEDNHKVRSIILASMTNEIQKQYDRLEDVPSIMLRMKDVYAVSDRHIRYATIKAFFGTKMTEGSCVHSHGVKMLSLVEKLNDLKAGLNNDTRGFDLQGKGKGARRWKRKKGKGTAVTATASTGGAPPAARRKRAKGRLGVLSGQRQMMCACIAKERGIGKRECPQLLSNPGAERSRRLSKAEMILRLGDGKAVAAEAVGSLRLVSNLIMTAQHKRKMDNHENAQIWHARLGHISKDRISRLVDKESRNRQFGSPTNLRILSKGKMTKKPFAGQSTIANGLLDLVHTDVCGPLSIPARGGFSYFITFTDDHGMVMFT
ncbi:UNVERIFIED_CONTAM: hypothetical protein Slati_1442300 [Sesamum latifolium]|uniref:GAG-pre-integrase domain-containing protein n=1 Tax=Sesamum latifolium TaxID=2727402 RepID=A0AAW2X6K3_9LAMI